MKTKHARQIRSGVTKGKQLTWFTSARHRATLYAQYMQAATYLEWYAFDQYRQRHWTD